MLVDACDEESTTSRAQMQSDSICQKAEKKEETKEVGCKTTIANATQSTIEFDACPGESPSHTFNDEKKQAERLRPADR